MPQKTPSIPWSEKPKVAKALKLRMQQVGYGTDKNRLAKDAEVQPYVVRDLMDGVGGSVEMLQKLLLVLNNNPADPQDKPFPAGTGVKELIAWHKENKDAIKETLGATKRRFAEEAKAAADDVAAAEVRARALAIRLGKTIKSRREELGVSQIELGKQVGFTTRQAISNYELGRFRPANDESFPTIVLALGYPEGTARSLEEDTPSMPAWVTELRGQGEGQDAGGHQQRTRRPPRERGR